MADFIAERSDVKSHGTRGAVRGKENRVWKGERKHALEVGVGEGVETKTGNSIELFRVVREVEGGGSRESVKSLFRMGLHGGSSCFVLSKIVQF